MLCCVIGENGHPHLTIDFFTYVDIAETVPQIIDFKLSTDILVVKYSAALREEAYLFEGSLQ